VTVQLPELYSAVRNLARALFETDRPAAIAPFLQAQGYGAPETARDFLWRQHVPLLLVFPLAYFACPAVWILFAFERGGPPDLQGALLPVFVAFALLCFAALLDRMVLHDEPPALRDNQSAPLRNVALFFHLPLSGAGLFFLLHPVAGWLGLLAAWLYSLWTSLEALRELQGKTRARIYAQVVQSGIVLLAPAALALLVFNIVRTVGIFREYGG